MPTVHYHAGFTAGAVGSHEAVALLEPVLHETLVVQGRGAPPFAFTSASRGSPVAAAKLSMVSPSCTGNLTVNSLRSVTYPVSAIQQQDEHPSRR